MRLTGGRDAGGRVRLVSAGLQHPGIQALAGPRAGVHARQRHIGFPRGLERAAQQIGPGLGAALGQGITLEQRQGLRHVRGFGGGAEVGCGAGQAARREVGHDRRLLGRRQVVDGLVPEIEAGQRGFAVRHRFAHERQQVEGVAALGVIGTAVEAVVRQIVLEQRLQDALQDPGPGVVVDLVAVQQDRQQGAVGQRAGPGMRQRVHHRHHVGVVRDQGAAQVIHIGGALFLAIGGQPDRAGRETQVAQPRQVRTLDLGGPFVTQPEALAERAPGGEVEVLLAHRNRLSHGQQAVVERHSLAERQRQFAQRLCITQIGEPRLGGHAGQFDEIAGVAGQRIGAGRRVAKGAGELLRRGRQGRGVRVGRRQAVLEQGQRRRGALAQFGVVLRGVAVQHDGVAHHFQRLGARIDVAVQVQDALRRQQLSAGLQQCLLRRRRQVTIEAGDDHVVELAQLGADVGGFSHVQPQVGRAQPLGGRRALGHQGLGCVDADRLGLRMGQGEGQQAGAVAAADRQHAGMFQGDAVDPVQMGGRAQPGGGVAGSQASGVGGGLSLGMGRIRHVACEGGASLGRLLRSFYGRRPAPIQRISVPIPRQFG